MNVENKKLYDRIYHKVFCSQFSKKYLGVVEVCPKCGKKGYGYFKNKINKHTGVVDKGSTCVEHRMSLNGKKIHLRSCYIGSGLVEC